MNKNTDTRRKILNSAEELIVKKGLRATTISEIAANAGMKHTVVYYYFKNKDDLAAQIQTEYFKQIFEYTHNTSNKFNSRMTFLIQYTFNIHKKILASPILKALFFEKANFEANSINHLTRIVNLCIDSIRDALQDDYFELPYETVLTSLVIWEGSAKNLFYYSDNSMLSISMDEIIIILIRNLFINMQFETKIIDSAIKEFREQKY